MTDPRITIRTERNASRAKYGFFNTAHSDNSDIETIVASTGTSTSWINVANSVAKSLRAPITTDELHRLVRQRAERLAQREQAAEVAAEEAPQEELTAEAPAPTASGYAHRVLYATWQDAPATITVGDRVYHLTGRGREFRINDDAPSLHGPHLLGYEGDYGSYAYYA